MNLLCIFHHKWEDIPKPYPKLRVIAIRGCKRCGRIEGMYNYGWWHRFAEGWTVSKWVAHMVKYYPSEVPEYYLKFSVNQKATSNSQEPIKKDEK